EVRDAPAADAPVPAVVEIAVEGGAADVLEGTLGLDGDAQRLVSQHVAEEGGRAASDVAAVGVGSHADRRLSEVIERQPRAVTLGVLRLEGVAGEQPGTRVRE